jgi:hypothetical protein
MSSPDKDTSLGMLALVINTYDRLDKGLVVFGVNGLLDDLGLVNLLAVQLKNDIRITGATTVSGDQVLSTDECHSQVTHV